MNKKINLVLLAISAQLLHTQLEARIEQTQIKKLLSGKENLAYAVIIGSGPAGYAASIPLSRAGYQPIIFQGPKPGGELMDAAVVENWPAVTKESGAANMNKLEKQAVQFGALLDSASITDIDFTTWPYKLTTNADSTVYALTVIIATGASQKKLGIENEDIYWGQGLFSCGICDAAFTQDRDAVVIGGGDIAIQRALQIAPRAKSVTLVIPGNRLTATESMQKKIRPLNHVHVLRNKVVKKLEGDGTNITHIELEDLVTGEKSQLATQAIFLSTGLTPNAELFKNKLELDGHGCIKLKDGRTQETAIECVMAAGTVSESELRYRQVATVIGEGTKAGIDALRNLAERGFDGPLKDTLKGRVYKPAPLAPIQQIRSIPELLKIIKREQGPIIIEFYSPLCSHCKKMEAPFSALAQKFQDKLKAYKVNKDKLFKTIRMHQIQMIPAFIIFQGGKEIARYEGETSQNSLFKFVEDSCKFEPMRSRSLCFPLDVEIQHSSSKEISRIG